MRLWRILMLMVMLGTQQLSAQELLLQPQVVSSTDEFTPENLKEYIRLKGIKHPEIVYAQAIVETGNFTSLIYKSNNNLFGMKYIHDCKCKITRNGTRQTTAIGSKYRHARYLHWKHSVDDYLLWQQMFKVTPIGTEKQYYALLHKFYAEDKDYIIKVKRVIARNKSNEPAAVAIL